MKESRMACLMSSMLGCGGGLRLFFSLCNSPAYGCATHRLAQRRPLRPGRSHGMGGKQRYRLHFGLAGKAALRALAAEVAANLRFHHAMSSEPKLRTYASFAYQAGSWKPPRRVVAWLECSLLPGENGMRQEVEIRYVVTWLKGSPRHLYENIYCHRGQMENLIKLHKAQLASDRMPCHSATANQVRLALHTAAFWLMRGVRGAIPPDQSTRKGRIRDAPRAFDQDRGTCDRAHRASASSCLPVARRERCSEQSHSP